MSAMYSMCSRDQRKPWARLYRIAMTKCRDGMTVSTVAYPSLKNHPDDPIGETAIITIDLTEVVEQYLDIRDLLGGHWKHVMEHGGQKSFLGII